MTDQGEEVFCYGCRHSWPRNQYGLTCPNCDSEFTEIFDQHSNLPMHELEYEPTPDPEPESPQSTSASNPLEDHNPWADSHEQSSFHEYGDGLGFTRRYQSSDGHFSFTTTTITSGSPFSIQRTLRGGTIRGSSASDQPDPIVPLLRSFGTIFQGLAGSGPQQGNPPHYHWSSGTSGRLQPEELYGGDGNARGTFRATGGLFPRNADGPQPMPHPENINDILNLLRLGASLDGHEGGPNMGRGVRPMPDNPLSIISAILSGGRHGDAVYSQEELDRVISQLIDQNINGNAPPPASESAIQALPRKKIDKEMLGPDAKAECSICMESVDLDTEVAILPCKHWFHFLCIEMWLNQHNTCPHCRRGINLAERASHGGTMDNPVVIPGRPEDQLQSLHSSRSGYQHYHHQRSSSTQNESRFGSVSRSNSDDQQTERRRPSRNEEGSGNSGGITGWVRSHFGGG